MRDVSGKVAFITGGASGIGLAMAEAFGAAGMSVMLADIEEMALNAAVKGLEERQIRAAGVLCDVAHRSALQEAAEKTLETFGKVHVVCNNAGVGAGGLIWEHTAADWDWVIGVNLMGVAHGVRVFTPLMLAAAKADPAWHGHIVNTASMAGLLNAPNMGVYNVTKHAVVSLSETLYQDLSLVTDQVHAHVLCPYFVPTGIHRSERNRPEAFADAQSRPTKSQLIAQAMSDKAVTSGKVSAAEVVQFVFEAMAQQRFYIYSHPKSLGHVQTRLEDIMTPRNPSDPFAARPEIGANSRAALRGA